MILTDPSPALLTAIATGGLALGAGGLKLAQAVIARVGDTRQADHPQQVLDSDRIKRIEQTTTETSRDQRELMGDVRTLTDEVRELVREIRLDRQARKAG
jgi:hypothetical protein